MSQNEQPTHNPSPRIPRLSPLASRANWSLRLGGLIVLLTLVVVVAGPSLAPRDPAQENAIVRVGEEWKIPPFAMLSVPGFPLGSDEFGRDLFSRLLWAVRPTMSMVIVVAAVRLTLGVLIGLCAGWFTGWRGRALDGLIGIFLSIPVLMVALGAIAAVGVEAGIKAFIIGLAINGWVETAQMVREQTRIIKNEMYIEAARALGSSDAQIILGHALRQIMPMIWMLFAFEISGTLMVTAALGFLGYYIGGDVWVVVTDRVARRISGTPELGQMLATTWVQIDKPWGMIAVGSTIFVVVLGFNLLGRGLRRRLTIQGLPTQTFVGQVQHTISVKLTEPVSLWTEEQVWRPLAAWAQARARLLAWAGLAALVIGGGLLMGWAVSAREPQEDLVEMTIPEGHFWATERRDPQGTLWSQTSGDITPEIQWTFEDASGFSGGPAVSEQGIVYVASTRGTLYSLTPGGNVLWQASLPAGAVGTPALDSQGQIYVSDKAGNLSAFNPRGELQWRFAAEDDDFSTSGPIVAPDGTIYYMLRGSTVQAVSAAGQGLWKTQALYQPTFSPPRLSASGAWLFVSNAVLDAQDGSLQEWETPMKVDQYLMGADGETYLQSGNDIIQWQMTATGMEAIHETTWDYRQFTVRAEGGPTDAGVSPQQLTWLLYSSNREDTRIVWVKRNGSTVGNTHYAQRSTRIIAVDRDGTTYACGQSRMGHIECMALAPQLEQPLWQIPLEATIQGQQQQAALRVQLGGDIKIGGARVPGRLYVALNNAGQLYAIGQGQQAQQIAAGQNAAPTEEPETSAPSYPSAEIAWTFQAPAGFSSGPAAADDGTIYIASKDGTLYALDQAGNTLWEVALPALSVGPPALDAQGNVYLADQEGALSAFAPDGSLRWRFTPPESKRPAVGPLVGPDGTIYYTVGSSVQAVSASGEGLWQTKSKTFRTRLPLRLTTSGDTLFYADDAFDTRDGRLLELESPVEVDQYIAGNDGQTYLRSQHTVMQWQQNETSIEIGQSAQWNYESLINAQAPPEDAGVTQGQVIWISYYGGTVFAWLEPTGQVLGTAQGYGGLLIAVLDQDATAYMCGMRRDRSLQCSALAPGNEEPVWHVELATEADVEVGPPVGGDLTPHRLYVATAGGFLYAIGQGQATASASRATEIGPDSNEIAWTLQAGFVTGPAVSDDGTVYLASREILYALDPDGNTLWETALPAAPLAYPVLDDEGNIYLADKEGNLATLAPDGSLRWRFVPPESKPSTVGPLLGPDGTVYYTVGSSVQAVSASGEGLWQTRSQTFRTYTPLQLSPRGDLLFHADDVFDARSGELLELESLVEADQYIAGNDGQLYLRADQTVIQWQLAGSNVEIIQSAQWNYSGFSTDGLPPLETGITQKGVIWLMYTHTRVPTQIAWIDLEGQILGTAATDVGDGQIIAVRDQDATIHLCGIIDPYSDSPTASTPWCYILVPGSEEPIWQVELERSEKLMGGALGPGRLYVSTIEGVLYAIGGGPQTPPPTNP